MFKKSKAKEAAAIAALIDLRQKSLQQIEDQFAVIDGITDPADKIIKLDQLRGAIQAARTDVERKQTEFVDNRAAKRAGIVAGTVATATIAGCLSGGILVAPAIFYGLFSLCLAPSGTGIIAGTLVEKKKKKQLLEADQGLADFAKIMEVQGTRAAALLEETQKKCDLNELSASPLLSDEVTFTKFVNNHGLLRDRFDAVVRKAAARNDKAQPDPMSGRKLLISKNHLTA